MARQERSAGFILFHQPAEGPVQYLLLDYGRHWDFPKGHVEKGESDLEAAIRELREETGIADAEVLDGFRHEVVYYFRHKRHGLVRKTVIFFLARASGTDVQLSDEHSGYVFLPFAEAVKRVSFPTARQVLRAAHERLEGGMNVNSE